MRLRSGRLTFPTTAAMVSGLLALASASPAFAQGAAPPGGAAKPDKPAAAADKGADAASKPKPLAPPGKAVGGAADKTAAGDTAAADKTAEKPKKPLTAQQKKTAAKKAFKEAEAKFDKGDYAGALELYRESDELVPDQKAKYKLAVALDKLNKVPEAVAAYQSFLDAQPDPKKSKDQITEAQARIDALKTTPAKVKIATTPEAPPGLKLTVDGVEQPLAAGNELSLAPGKHTIAVTAEGYEPSTQEIEVKFAETRDVPVALNQAAPPPPPPVAAAPPPPVAPEAPPPPKPAAEPRSKVPAYVTLGLAGAGAVVGTIFGIQALGAKSDFEEKPTTESADSADRNALIADMSFAVALTFGVTGAVLLLSDDSADEPKAATLAPKKKSAPRKAFVTPYVGPTGGGAAARFTF